MINQTDLKYFVEVAKTQNLSRAAERVGISQSALSHCLKRLEHQLGCELFLRTKKGVTLTSPGERFLSQADELILQWEKLFQSVKEDVDEASGVIKLGCHSAVAQYSLPLFLPSFMKSHPKIEVRLQHGLSRHVTEEIISSRLDVALVINPVSHPDLVLREIFTDEVALWRSKSCQNPELLMIEPNLLQTQNLLAKLAKRGLRFTRTIESSSLEVLTQLLIAGTGCAILPSRCIPAGSKGKIQMVKGSPVYKDKLCLAFRPEFLKTKRGKVFVEAARALSQTKL